MISKDLLAGSLFIVILGCNNAGQSKHVDASELTAARDSLQAYKDSLRAVQMGWTFNMLTPVVQMDEYEHALGDTCHARVRIAAANDWDNGYRFDKPRLILTSPRSNDRSVVVTDETYFWNVAFVPQRIGRIL